MQRVFNLGEMVFVRCPGQLEYRGVIDDIHFWKDSHGTHYKRYGVRSNGTKMSVLAEYVFAEPEVTDEDDHSVFRDDYMEWTKQQTSDNYINFKTNL